MGKGPIIGFAFNLKNQVREMRTWNEVSFSKKRKRGKFLQEGEDSGGNTKVSKGSTPGSIKTL